VRALVAACVLLGGCAALAPAKPEPPPLRPGEVVSATAAKAQITLGKTTQAEVRAALGEGTVVDFDSGYEVWVYRQPAAPASELVLLFDPSGIVAKARVR
jgi:hypothetical protein